jgi:hypothetical protein
VGCGWASVGRACGGGLVGRVMGGVLDGSTGWVKGTTEVARVDRRCGSAPLGLWAFEMGSGPGCEYTRFVMRSFCQTSTKVIAQTYLQWFASVLPS